jgi:hypothetical protein
VTYSALVGATVLLWATLYGLMLARWEPVVLSAAPAHERGLTKEAYPYLSIGGSLLWILVLVLYTVALSRISARGFSFDFKGPSARPFISLFFINCAFVTVVHPNLLITLVRPQRRPGFSRFIERWLPGIDQLYFHWGFQRWKLWLPLVHALLVSLYVLFVVDLGRHQATAPRPAESR